MWSTAPPTSASWARTSCSSSSPTCTSRWTWVSASAAWWWPSRASCGSATIRPSGRGCAWRRSIPTLTEHYFSERGIQVEIVRLDGSIELAPLVGLAERIVDLVQSGETLRANGLVEVAEIMTSTARLIVNRASLKTAHARVNALIHAMRREVSSAPPRAT